jgi:hypothetical protein
VRKHVDQCHDIRFGPRPWLSHVARDELDPRRIFARKAQRIGIQLHAAYARKVLTQDVAAMT